MTSGTINITIYTIPPVKKYTVLGKSKFNMYTNQLNRSTNLCMASSFSALYPNSQVRSICKCPATLLLTTLKAWRQRPFRRCCRIHMWLGAELKSRLIYFDASAPILSQPWRKQVIVVIFILEVRRWWNLDRFFGGRARKKASNLLWGQVFFGKEEKRAIFITCLSHRLWDFNGICLLPCLLTTKKDVNEVFFLLLI